MQGYGEDDYLIFDCPGQIELYTHVSVFRSFVDFLKRDGWSVAAVYCTDCQFVGDPTKFIAGSLQVRWGKRLRRRFFENYRLASEQSCKAIVG